MLHNHTCGLPHLAKIMTTGLATKIAHIHYGQWGMDIVTKIHHKEARIMNYHQSAAHDGARSSATPTPTWPKRADRRHELPWAARMWTCATSRPRALELVGRHVRCRRGSGQSVCWT